MDDLVRWLNAQLDEDERIARAATDGPWSPWRRSTLHGLGDLIHSVVTPGQKPGSKAVIVTAAWLDAEHIAEWDPARVLREIDAKRKALDHYTELRRLAKGGVAIYRSAAGAVEVQIQIMALAYADRPGYQEAWRPEHLD